jgi:hypothetical protein
MEKSSDKYNYSFGMPNEAIWGSHILMGLFFVYVGYELVMKRKLSIAVALTLVVLGALGALYHIHLWYEGYSSKKVPPH